MSVIRVGVVGGGLAGMAAALAAADEGADVVLFERRRALGGLTTSIERDGLTFDNGQHVFLRCCTAYRGLLERIGAAGQVHLQDRLDVAVLAPNGARASISRSGLPAPLHLARSLATYRHLGVADRLRLARGALAMRRLDPDDAALDAVALGPWLAAHGQSLAAIERLWDLIALPTINVRARDASLALAVRVFREGLLDHRDAGDVGWSRVPLSELHAANGARALARAGVEVRVAAAVRALEPTSRDVVVRTDDGASSHDAVVVATPPAAAAALGVLDAGVAERLGSSPIVNVHLLLDRRVTDLEMFAAVGSEVQFVFDRTASSGLASGQCLALSLSGADAYMGVGARELAERFHAAVSELLPEAARARLVDAVVTRERAATFRGVPGTAALRPSAPTSQPGVYLAGAWCATGWPATMEGAVRSGQSAATAALAGRTAATCTDFVGMAT